MLADAHISSLGYLCYHINIFTIYHYHHHYHNHYKTIYIIIIIVVVIVITTVWNKNMLKKRWSICQIRWDTIVIFISQSTKTLQLKKGLNFNMQKITSQSKLYVDCNDCGMAQYMYFDYKITFTTC